MRLKRAIASLAVATAVLGAFTLTPSARSGLLFSVNCATFGCIHNAIGACAGAGGAALLSDGGGGTTNVDCYD
jgi:hypothetical protein